MKVYTIIPACNEENNISEVINHAKKYCDKIIVVDDGSTDGTAQKAKALGVEVIRHEQNLGKGAALRTGADRAIKDGAEILIFIDADRQHEPHEIPVFLEKLKNAEIVFGSRRRTPNMPFVHRIGNIILTLMARILFRVKIHDTQSGYRAMTAETYLKIRWRSNDYSAETEMIANVGKNKIKYDEIFVKTIYHDTKKGTTAKHGIMIAMDMIKWKVRG